MNSYLILFSITPVQSFIEQARKTQDLYAGSFLLSHLCRISANTLKEKGGEIVFPKIENPSIPNRFLSIVKQDSEKIKEILTDVENRVSEEFSKIAHTIMKEFDIIPPQGFIEQLKGFFTVNWLAIPFDEIKYNELYTKAESLMGAIKNVRKFSQLSVFEKGRKCSICGERNVKLYRLAEKEKESEIKAKKLFSNNVFIVSYKDYKKIEPKFLKSGEGLCAICFTKRALEKVKLEGYKSVFPSTAKIALFSALEKLKTLREDLISIIDNDKFEPQGIFALKHNRSLDEFDLEEDERKNTEIIYQALKDNQIEYSPYYAVMLFDGDNMGEWLSGKKTKGNLQIFHQSLTEKLGQYAKQVSEIVKPYYGVTVYAGGDDFLGLFNLDHLFEKMRELYIKFDEMVNQQLKSFYKQHSYNLTFSAGVVVAHFKTPLGEALKWARKMEQEAKDIDSEKDAFAIAVLKHSGNVEKATIKWRIGNICSIEIFETLSTQLKEDRISNTFIKRLASEMLKLTDSQGNYSEIDLIKTEISRLIERSFIKLREEKEEEFQRRKKDTTERLRLSLLLEKSGTFSNFISILNITDFISKHIKGEV